MKIESALIASTDALTNGAAARRSAPQRRTRPGGSAINRRSRTGGCSLNRRSTPAHCRPISIQTIANAYGDYTKKSLHETGSFVEKLMAVRSFDKAIEVQTEFARQAYANFVAESQKICELYGELASRSFSGLGKALRPR